MIDDIAHPFDDRLGKAKRLVEQERIARTVMLPHDRSRHPARNERHIRGIHKGPFRDDAPVCRIW